MKEIPYLQVILSIYDIYISTKEFKDPKDAEKQKLQLLENIKKDILKIITPENYSKLHEEINQVLRHYFLFYANHEEYYIEGLKFFSLFSEITKQESFNSIKAFVFYFAYQSKYYSSKIIKELLEQNLIMSQIYDHRTYLDFCMYCFYRGMYFLENKDFYMTCYYYCAAVESGLKGYNNDKLLNGFSCQMIRSLCFLRYLTKFDVKSKLFKESRYHSFDDSLMIDHQDISLCLNFIRKENFDYNTFKAFVKEDEENIKKCSLLGLKNLAEEEIIFNIIKDNLKIYKKIKLLKLEQLTQLRYNDIKKVLKKKVLIGEINIKYDESEDIIEIFDIDPGLKERVEKTKALYQKIIEGNKNLFTDLKIRKMNKIAEKDNNMIINIAGAGNYILSGDMDDVHMEEEDD